MNIIIHENGDSFGMEARDDNGERASWGGAGIVESRYCGKYIPTLRIGGIGTRPEYRRGGNVREMFYKLFEIMRDGRCYVSMLHPFSTSYYRKFGYEKICDHKVLEFPITKLDFVERCPDLICLRGNERVNDCVEIYNRFADRRNIMFRREGSSHFVTDPDGGGKKTYIWYDKDGKPASYITLAVENYYNVNRMTSINLNVYEMAFTTPDSLRALFGFMRMYEGENDTVKIHNCAMSPEIDTMLRHYIHTGYTLIPDIMARVLNVKGMLEANEYPREYGHFRVKVEDSLDYTRGVWEVEYKDGVGEARLVDTEKYDFSAAMPAFTQLIYGYDAYDEEIARFMDGVKIEGDCNDFFRAFRKKHNGLFEHF